MAAEDVFCTNCGAKVAKITHEEFTVSADNLVDRVRELLHEGNVTRVIIKDVKGRVLLEIPDLVLSKFRFVVLFCGWLMMRSGVLPCVSGLVIGFPLLSG